MPEPIKIFIGAIFNTACFVVIFFLHQIRNGYLVLFGRVTDHCFMTITFLLLLITLLACSESEPILPEEPIDRGEHNLKGTYNLVKAVGWQLMDVGGERGPLLIRRVPHTYDYSHDPIGWLVFGEDYFFMHAPIKLQPLFVTGNYKIIEPITGRFPRPARLHLRYRTWHPNSFSYPLSTCCPKIDFFWTEDNLLIFKFLIGGGNIEWELYWKYNPTGAGDQLFFPQ